MVPAVLIGPRVAFGTRGIVADPRTTADAWRPRRAARHAGTRFYYML